MGTKKKLIVSKFGGSSMKDATAIKRSANLAKNRQTQLIVVSATYGTTNELITLSQTALSSNWKECQQKLEHLQNKHLEMARQLECTQITVEKLQSLLREAETLTKGIHLLKDCGPKTLDRLLSAGERLSSHLMATALSHLCPNKEVKFFDVRKVMRTDDQFSKATPQLGQIQKLAIEHLKTCIQGKNLYVTQGFLGATEEGITTTLGRGGSDYSAALLAEAISADVLEIWTDVAGIASTDPRLVPEAKPISEMTFQEASELATFGAKVLHPTTLTPAVRASIPVFVGSSYKPESQGTWIRQSCDHLPLIRAMAIRQEQSLLTIQTPKMLNAHGFLSRIFEIFARYQVSIDAITTSEISIGLTVDKAVLNNKSLLKSLSEQAEVHREDDLALVSLIGNNINHTPGLAQRVFNGLAQGEKAINVRMICLGASRHNFCLVVKEGEATEAIQRLHREFIH